jgi:hypothetical protein
MVDISLPGLPSRGQLITRASLAKAIALLSGLLLALSWSAVDNERLRCEFKQGGFSGAFNSAFDRGSCKCKQPKLDFSDPCNSMYLPML